MTTTNTDESSIDFPKANLCTDVWEEVIDATGAAKVWYLTDDAECKIVKLSKYLMGKLSIKNYAVHIVGSITSNQYTKNSDIDVHFVLYNDNGHPVALAENVQKSYTQLIRDDFDNYYRQQFPEDSMIGSHLIEVYFQGNFYQDLMSVGCYDVFSKKWLVGPSFEDQSFNPYSEYYKDIQNSALKDANKIRNQILATYEAAVLYIKSPTEEFAQMLVNELDNAANQYERLHALRSSTTQPMSVEDALNKRSSREWKVADAGFKLLDKFGYIGILKEISTLDDLAISSSVLEEIAQTVITVVKTKLGDKQKLEETQIDEGIKELLSVAAICGMLAIPGIMPQEALAAQMKKVPKQEMNINSKQVKKAMIDATKAKSYNGMSATNIINAVARTIYAEGKDQSRKGRAAIASVIWNRAGGNPENFINVISKKLQFSCWNKYSGGWKDNTYIFKLSYLNDKNISNAKMIWDECIDLATQMYNKTFKSTIGNRNSYMNKKKAEQHNVDSWGKELDLKIDDQYFGYTRNNDGFRQHSQQQIYIVKKGDTLQKIAKTKNISLDELAAKNGIIDKNKLKVGQKLII